MLTLLVWGVIYYVAKPYCPPENSPCLLELHAIENGQGQWVLQVEWSPDGRMIAAGLGWIRVWNVENLPAVSDTTMLINSAIPFIWSPDSSYIFALDRGQVAVYLQLWDVTLAQKTSEVLIYAGIQNVSWHPDGEGIALAVTSMKDVDDHVLIWDWLAQEEISRITPSGVYGVWFSPTGLLAISTSSVPDGSIEIWDIETDQKIHEFNTGALNLEWSSDGNRIAVAIVEDFSVSIFDLAENDILHEFEVEDAGGIHDLAWSPDGHWLAVADNNGTVTIFDTFTGETVNTTIAYDDGNKAGIGSVDWSLDGRFLATGGIEDGVVRIWAFVSSPK